jgi:LIVCS family branched-chain amino acid:cation transporter
MGCLIGVLVGQFDVSFIIYIALPALMFIYPIAIVLIILNSLPKKFSSPLIFRAVTLITFVFSIPDFLEFFMSSGSLDSVKQWIPFAKQGMGWVLPGLLVFISVNIFKHTKKTKPADG